jgi:hypothetical protein
VCDISLKISRRGLQLCFRSHQNRRSAHEVMGPQSRGRPVVGIPGFPLGSPGIKCHFDVAPVGRRKEYYKGEGGGFPKSGPWLVLWVLWVQGCSWLVLWVLWVQGCSWLVLWVLWVQGCSWLVLTLKSAQTMHGPTCCLVCANPSEWISCLSFFPSPILKLQHAPLPPKCCEPRSMPQLLTLSLFSLQTHIWVY